MGLIKYFDKKISMYTLNNIKESCKSVEWLSYHIPKTAGTSFRKSLCEAYGSGAVYGVYVDTNAKEFSEGELAWIPSKTKLLHGHFYPHKNHSNLFQNAKKIIWLRDPIKRAWSLLNHTLDVNNNQIVKDYLTKKFLNHDNISREEMFLEVLADKNSERFFTRYHKSLANFPKSFFDFVGKTEDYENGIAILSGLMDKELKNFNVNVSVNKSSPPTIPSSLLSYFDKEFKIYDKLTQG